MRVLYEPSRRTFRWLRIAAPITGLAALGLAVVAHLTHHPILAIIDAFVCGANVMHTFVLWTFIEL